jgi:hypothetical protein
MALRAQVIEHLKTVGRAHIDAQPFAPLTVVDVVDRAIAQAPTTAFAADVGIVLTSDPDWARVLNVSESGIEHIDSVRCAGLRAAAEQ